MKKIISLLLALAMLFSMAMPAMAAEGDTYTLYVDISQVADSTKEVSGVWLYAYGGTTQVLNKQMTHVSGTVYSYPVSSGTRSGSIAVVYTDSRATYIYAAESTGKNFYTPTGESVGTWSTYGSVGDITGSTAGNVSGTYDPTIVISDIALSGDAVAVDEENRIYTVTVPTDAEKAAVTVTVSGQNLDKIPEENYWYKIVFEKAAEFRTDTYDSNTGKLSWNEEVAPSTVEHAIQYSTDNGATWTETGWTVIVKKAEVEIPTTKTIYFDNTEGWSTVYAYAWDAASIALLGDWPGSALTKVEGEENIYSIEVPTDAVNMIFNNGRVQTADLTIPTDDKNLYTYSTNEWSVYGSTEPTYAITTIPTGGGTITVPDSAAAGDTVTVTFTPNEGHVLFKQYAYATETPDVDVILTQGADAYTYTFTMPAHAVQVVGEFAKDGKAREDLYFNNDGNSAWTNVEALFLTDTGLLIDTVFLTMAENGVYTLPEDTVIPNLTYKVYFVCSSGNTVMVDIPTGEENMFTLGTTTNAYGHYYGTWSKYTPSQPPAGVTSADITWGSMAFTYTDEAGKWSVDGTAEDAGTVTVKNTGSNTFTAQAAYASATDEYGVITGSFDPASCELTAEGSCTFTLKLSGKPNKAIPAGTKIGEVTITISESAEG